MTPIDLTGTSEGQYFLKLDELMKCYYHLKGLENSLKGEHKVNNTILSQKPSQKQKKNYKAYSTGTLD